MIPRVTLTPLDKRCQQACDEYGYEWDVLAIDQKTILVKSLDGELTIVFNTTEAEWPERLLEG